VLDSWISLPRLRAEVPQPILPAGHTTAATPATSLRDLAAAYTATGGGARDDSARQPAQGGLRSPLPGGRRIPARAVATPVSPEQFARRMLDLGVADEVLPFLGRIQSLPSPMRILALETLYHAQSAEDVREAIRMTDAMPRS